MSPERPLAQFSDEQILLAAMALNRGARVEALEPRDDTAAALLTDVLLRGIDEELMIRNMAPRRMARDLFDKMLRALRETLPARPANDIP